MRFITFYNHRIQNFLKNNLTKNNCLKISVIGRIITLIAQIKNLVKIQVFGRTDD